MLNVHRNALQPVRSWSMTKHLAYRIGLQISSQNSSTKPTSEDATTRISKYRISHDDICLFEGQSFLVLRMTETYFRFSDMHVTIKLKAHNTIP